MSTKGSRFFLAASVLGSLWGVAPVMAQSHGGGGHSSGGGGHASSGGHFGGGSAGPAHAGAVRGYGGYGGAAYGHGYPAAYRGGYGGHPGAYYGHGYYGHGYYGHGYYGHGYSTGAYWRGGYWRGGFWPRAYYGVGFSWFLPILPLAYATYYYSGVPYYYANDVYYTYNPSYEGYVATDPPPVADATNAAPANAAPPPGDGAAMAGEIYMYPKNGQSTEQQAKDKAECQQWATQQAGQVAQNGSDYQRAMTACVEGRGYSAR